jgi:two-component system response regulator
VDALEKMQGIEPDLLICDLAMPRMNGLALVEHLRNEGNQTPILVISATENMSDIAKALRLGVQDVLLKPIKDLNRLRETVFACLYPAMFNSRVEEEERLFQDWDALTSDPQAAAKLLQELQPPVQQVMSHCRVNYRQLIAADQPGLVLDIAPLSENDLAFYCLDVTRAGDNGVLAALLLRALFNGLLQEQLSHQRQRLPELGNLLKQVNQLLRQANLTGQFPLIVGYYHSALKNLILVSAGLNATLNTGEHQIQVSNGVPLGTLGNTYLNQISQRCEAWQCQVWGSGGRLRLMLSAE